MKRTKEQRRKITFRKIGGGSFRLPTGKIVKPNETFEAFPEEIPQGFHDVVKALEPLPEDTPLEPVSNFELEKATAPEEKGDIESDDFEVSPREDEEGMYNVVDATSGKAINEKPLEKEQADELLKSLVE